jgi:hypothetical protein
MKIYKRKEYTGIRISRDTKSESSWETGSRSLGEQIPRLYETSRFITVFTTASY